MKNRPPHRTAKRLTRWEQQASAAITEARETRRAMDSVSRTLIDAAKDRLPLQAWKKRFLRSKFLLLKLKAQQASSRLKPVIRKNESITFGGKPINLSQLHADLKNGEHVAKSALSLYNHRLPKEKFDFVPSRKQSARRA